ncbi:hypothetical protein [Amycolatopsis sp. H20-H5]|uniref:hypothetical protein n=1 Tax=Amycolatopsis sp. H20-H5 TaxID=3046309 RepID=UPI002DB73C52|nr:hypothetical protein [Amycolatopsis sp. H20-H5]MEC3974750.1 hypothetical protein [Amycolatopsis sp. H20-H5]
MATGGNAHLTVNDAQRAEERIRAYELKLLGWSNRRIAGEMGCSHTKIAYLIDEEADSRVLPLADRYRKHALDQLDLAIMKVMEQLSQDRAVARNAEVLVKLIERKSRFIGADAPVQQEITATVEQRPAELVGLVAKARALVAEQSARSEDR